MTILPQLRHCAARPDLTAFAANALASASLSQPHPLSFRTFVALTLSSGPEPGAAHNEGRACFVGNSDVGLAALMCELGR